MLAGADKDKHHPRPRPRILHLLHTLPVQAVLLDVPADRDAAGAAARSPPAHPAHLAAAASTASPPTMLPLDASAGAPPAPDSPYVPAGMLAGVAYSAGGSACPTASQQGTPIPRRHSRTSTFSVQQQQPAHQQQYPPIGSPDSASGAPGGVRPSALVAALGEIQAQQAKQAREARERERALAAGLGLVPLRLLPTKDDDAGIDPEARGRARKWALAPRRGHSALYAGVLSLAGREHSPAAADAGDGDTGAGYASASASAAERPPLSAASSLPGDAAHECVYIGTLGPIVDRYGRAVDGYALSDDDKTQLARMLRRDMACEPVFVDAATAAGHYEGYCKTCLWPLFHYQLPTTATDGRREKLMWKAYEDVNRAFAEVAAHVYQRGDLIEVQDYHLLLTPRMIREALAEREDGAASEENAAALAAGAGLAEGASIGLFVHTPFPSSEIFRCLPQRAPLLEGILAASLVGFQTYSYARHFTSCCTRVLGLESSPTGIDNHGHHVALAICPIGIDAERTHEKRLHPRVLEKAAALRDMYAGKKIVVGRDKLDSMRGVYQKLKGFESFLEIYPEWRGKVVLVQVTSPTTTGGQLVSTGGAKAFAGGAKLEAKVSELVAQINGKYGSLDYSPVHHIHRAIAQDEFLALMTAADAGVITSVRDGMSTTSHEFVVCQSHPQGTFAPLILSEFTGCASSLAGALLVNPWDAAGLAHALHEALTMPREERHSRHLAMLDVVSRYTASQWARSFTRALEATAVRGAGGHGADAHTTPLLDRAKCLRDYRAVAQDLPSVDGEVPVRRMRLFALDYDGTLAPIVKVPELARPAPELLEALERLCADPLNRVFVISGRDQACLDTWLGHIPGLGLSAEHGSFLKMPHDPRGWIDLTENDGTDPEVWKAEVVSCFNFYTERTPGSFIEHKRRSVTWHYRQADPYFGPYQAREAQLHLESSVLAKRPLELLVGKCNLEVRPMSVNKGEIVKRLLATAAPPGAVFDFVFCVGDDRTDEDMAKALNEVMTPGPASPRPAHGVLGGSETKAVSLPSSKMRSAQGIHRVWTCTVGPATKRTLFDWHVNTPAHVIDTIREWADLPRARGASPVPANSSA